MTYGQFLLLFLAAPTGFLLFWLRRRLHRRRLLSLAAMMVIALLYTTPWDNYLVAHRIWWYEPEKVLGWTLGWVPLEEYMFFLLQPLFTGSLLLAISGLLGGEDRSAGGKSRGGLRLGAAALLAALWLSSLPPLLSGAAPRLRYLSLLLTWALPPLALQAAFGADLLARRLGRAGLALAISTLYLLAADAVAISMGIWTIDPAQTLGWDPLPGVVFEEAVFFLLTNALVIGGLTLLSQKESLERWRGFWTRVLPGRAGRSQVAR